MGQAFVGKKLGNDAGDLAAGLERRVGNSAHDADLEAAIDQFDAVATEIGADFLGALQIEGVLAVIDTAKNADRGDVAHTLTMISNLLHQSRHMFGGRLRHDAMSQIINMLGSKSLKKGVQGVFHGFAACHQDLGGKIALQGL